MAAKTDGDEEKWYKRQDIWVFVAGFIFIGALMGAMFGIGAMRGWDAPSGYTHANCTDSQERFLPEPYRNTPDLYAHVPGRSGPDATGLWYYWKLKPENVTVWTRFFVWSCYTAHQLTIWLLIYLAQMHKTDTANGSKYGTKLNKYNWWSFGVNMFFHVLHLAQTHITYDGLAQDVGIVSGQCTAIMLLVFVFVMEYPERGLFFGWPTPAHTGKISSKLRLNFRPMYIMRKYHSYGFAWAAIATVWYHPMENTYGHALGFFYTWIFLLQGSLMYTKLHNNKWWRLFQESWVCIHGGLVAVQTGGPDVKGTRLWPMFVFGYVFLFACTFIFILDFWKKIPWWTRVFPLLLALAGWLGAYSWIPNDAGATFDPLRLSEAVRIPAIYYLAFLYSWLCVKFFLFIDDKIHGSKFKQPTPVMLVVYFALFMTMYLLMNGISVVVDIYGNVIPMFVQMVMLIFIFMFGVGVTMVIMKRVIPPRGNKSRKVADEKTEKVFVAEAKQDIVQTAHIDNEVKVYPLD